MLNLLSSAYGVGLNGIKTKKICYHSAGSSRTKFKWCSCEPQRHVIQSNDVPPYLCITFQNGTNIDPSLAIAEFKQGYCSWMSQLNTGCRATGNIQGALKSMGRTKALISSIGEWLLCGSRRQSTGFSGDSWKLATLLPSLLLYPHHSGGYAGMQE